MTFQLLSPYSFAGLSLSNRVVMAPLTRGRAGAARVPNDLMLEYYLQRGSAGMIIAEATVVSKQGIGWVDSPGIYNDEQAAAWQKITSGLSQRGCPMILQLWHCGRASHSSFHGGELPVSASAVKLNGDQIHTPRGKEAYETPRALTVAEIKDVVADYRAAAQRALQAGFGGVEIHSANGYLINQFLDSRCNQRTDEYGGSLENRLRFLAEVVAAVCSVWPCEKVGVRLSPNGVFNDMGAPDFRETFLGAGELLNRLGVGFLHLMDGLAFGFHGHGEPMTLADFRPIYRGTVIGNCGYNQESAEAAIISGNADLIAFGRPYITNPDLVERFANGWPLAPDADVKVWSAPSADGYTTFPPYRN